MPFNYFGFGGGAAPQQPTPPAASPPAAPPPVAPPDDSMTPEQQQALIQQLLSLGPLTSAHRQAQLRAAAHKGFQPVQAQGYGSWAVGLGNIAGVIGDAIKERKLNDAEAQTRKALEDAQNPAYKALVDSYIQKKQVPQGVALTGSGDDFGPG